MGTVNGKAQTGLRATFFWSGRIGYGAGALAVSLCASASFADDPVDEEAALQLLEQLQQGTLEEAAEQASEVQTLQFEEDGASEAEPEAADAEQSPMVDLESQGQSPDDLSLPEGQSVEVGSFDQIDLHVQDLPLTQVLQLMSIQSQRNIVASRNVTGTVSADLYGVDFNEALEAILHANGYGYREEGNFIYVYTRDELAQLEEAERQIMTKVVRLNYATASDAATFIESMLSSAGSLAISGEAPAGMAPSDADAGANQFAEVETMVIRDYEENIEAMLEVIEQIDQRPRQVLVEATILQARLNEANAFGVDFALFADIGGPDFSSPLAAVDDLITGQAPSTGGSLVSDAGGSAGGSASVRMGYLGNDAAVFVRALDQVTDTTVLATPKILALNRQRAKLHVGERLGYLSTTATDTARTQSVEFLDVGTSLSVRPFVSDDDFVRLELRPEVSDGETRTVEGNVIPDTVSQELTTNVLVQSGNTVVLGGLFKEDNNVERRQVPGLGDIPGIGSVFRGQDDALSRSEVIFLIKPTIMRDPAMRLAGDEAKRASELAMVGARKNLLPWSRTKLTSSHMQKAQEHMRAGDREKALWNVNQALHLDPTLVDGLRMREQLTDEQYEFRSQSQINRAIEQALEGTDEAEAE